jgi:aspartate/methionine/tyrosine aminotransferase
VAIPFLLKKLLVRTRLARFVPGVRRLTDGGAEYYRYYADRVLAAPLTQLLDSATFLAPDVPDVMDLNRSAPQFDSPLSAGRLAADRHGLPPIVGLPELRERIADTYRTRHGRAFDPRQEVVVTHGATGAFAAVLDAFINPGDRVALFDPCSPLFGVGIASRRGRTRWIATANEEGRTRFAADALKTALRGAKLFALANPNNPTGGTLAPDDLEQIAYWANRYDVLLYLDESFSPFRYVESGEPLSGFTGAERRTLFAGSVTQEHGLRSVRVGWLAGPRHLLKACALTASLAAPFVPAVCQRVAARALETDEELFGPVLEEFRDRRRYVLDRLRGMGLEPITPAGGYFVWVPVASLGLDGRAFADRLLKEHGVRVGPGVGFGPSGTGFVRVSFATEDGRLREGLTRLAAFVTKLRGTPTMESATAEATELVQERPPSFSRV